MKIYILDLPETLTVEYVENFISESGYEPLRWAITKSESGKITVDAVIIDN